MTFHKISKINLILNFLTTNNRILYENIILQSGGGKAEFSVQRQQAQS